MRMDLSKFKVISSDGKSTTLRHPRGHQITIAHAALAPEHKEMFEAMAKGTPEKAPAKMAKGGKVKAEAPIPENDLDEDPKPENEVANNEDDLPMPPQQRKMADGGDVTPDQQPDAAQGSTGPADAAGKPPATININLGNPSMGQAAQVAPPPPPAPAPSLPSKDAAPYGVSPEQMAQMQEQASAPAPTEAPAPQAPAQMAAPGPAPDPYGTAATEGAFVQGLNETKAGLGAQAQAESAAGAAQAQDLQQGIQQQQKALATYQDHYNALDGERKKLMDSFQRQGIEPDRYINNMSTGEKIGTTIGLIAGGLAAGYGHGGNPAMDFLNKQIDRDIEAQRANLGKTQSLLDLNMRQFGNMRDATEMTKVMQMDIVSNQMKAAAAKAAGPMAKANLLKAAGQLDMQSAPMLGQMAMRRTILSSPGVPPEQKIRALVPPNEQPAAYKELQSAQNLARNRDNAMSAFDQVDQMTLGGALSPKKRDAIVQPILAQMVKDSEGRITPQDTKMIESLFPSALDGSAETRAVKRTQLNNFLTEKMHFPQLQAYGIEPASIGRYAPSGASKFQLAPPVKNK